MEWSNDITRETFLHWQEQDSKFFFDSTSFYGIYKCFKMLHFTFSTHWNGLVWHLHLFLSKVTIKQQRMKEIRQKVSARFTATVKTVYGCGGFYFTLCSIHRERDRGGSKCAVWWSNMEMMLLKCLVKQTRKPWKNQRHCVNLFFPILFVKNTP